MIERSEEQLLSQVELEEKQARIRDPQWEEFKPENFPETYQGSSFLNKLARQADEGAREVLISDVDWTFYHRDIPEITQKLSNILEKVGIPLAYCSGRSIEGISQQIDLPKPDLAISAVGTEIWVKQSDGTFKPDQNYRRELAKNWDRKITYNKVKMLVEKNADVLRFQEGADLPENQGNPDIPPPQEFKISLFFYGNVQEAKLMKEQFSRIFGDEIGVIFSTNWHEENCFYIDVLPKHKGKTGKAVAVNYLKSLAGFRSIVAGDGGNDADMLFNTGSQTIVVGNALPEMTDIVSSLPAKEDWRPKLSSTEISGMRNDVYIAEKDEIGPRAILNAMTRGDFNPGFAKKILMAELEGEK